MLCNHILHNNTHHFKFLPTFFYHQISASLHVEGFRYVFVDEIQYAPSFGKNMKYLFDTYKGKVKFFISGSSATDFFCMG